MVVVDGVVVAVVSSFIRAHQMERMVVAAETGTEVFHMALEMGMGTGMEI